MEGSDKGNVMIDWPKRWQHSMEFITQHIAKLNQQSLSLHTCLFLAQIRQQWIINHVKERISGLLFDSQELIVGSH